MTTTKTNHHSIQVIDDCLQFGKSPDKGGVQIRFMRTLRIPDDGKTYPLPPGFGSFPIRRVQDYWDKVPASWRERGGVFIPMFQREAMWMNFTCPSWRPRALQVGVGKICAVTGKPWSGKLKGKASGRLKKKKQNYLVVPKQPWLDGIADGKGSIRQFVAMPLGMGYTVEAQLTGEESFGGVQLQLFEPHRGLFPTKPPRPKLARMRSAAMAPPCAAPAPASALGAMDMCMELEESSMGLAAGGSMKQAIYEDDHGLQTWDASQSTRLFVHLCNSEVWRQITGEEAPSSPVTAVEYEAAGLPWYDVYDEGVAAVKGGKPLKGVKSVAELDKETFGTVLGGNKPVNINKIIGYDLKKAKGVYDGDW